MVKSLFTGITYLEYFDKNSVSLVLFLTISYKICFNFLSKFCLKLLKVQIVLVTNVIMEDKFFYKVTFTVKASYIARERMTNCE